MKNFKKPAETVTIRNVHQIYRVWEIPGMRDSRSYEGTGIEKTFDLSPTDQDYPPDEDACPALRSVSVGTGGQKEVMGKEVERKPLICPECEVQGVETHTGEKFCSECGLILTQGDVADYDSDEQFGSDGQRLERSASAAGRFDGTGNE